MSVGSISLWQQDQNYWQQAQAQSSASSADTSLINVMGTAETNLAKGLASIANKTALNRVNSQISALVQQALQGSSDNSTSSSGSTAAASANSTSASSTSSTPSPATGTGTVPLTTGTSLSTLGILPGGTISVSAGQNLTTYTSTGNDTVADLIGTLNVDLPTNAQVTASINGSGKLVITSRNHSDTFTVSGSGTDAAAIGFGVGHNTFEPPKVSSSTSATSGSSGSSSSSTSTKTASSSTSSTSTSSSSTANSHKQATDTLPAYQTFSSAASILSADGVSGSLVDMLA
jgi:hypothetical protein